MHNFNFDGFKHCNTNKNFTKHKSQTFNLQKQEYEPSTSNNKNKTFNFQE